MATKRIRLAQCLPVAPATPPHAAGEAPAEPVQHRHRLDLAEGRPAADGVPFFTLSKKPDLGIRRYEDRQGNTLEISAHSKGLPTIYDKDILIAAISQIMHRLNRGEEASPRVILYASDTLEFANRGKGGKDYRALDDAITRLRGCTIKTNIRTGDIYQTDIFGLIERGGFVRKYGFDGRLQHVEITLSEWLWEAIQARHVLTLHPDYFRLRKPLERRVYEIARKHCGRQAEWRISLSILREKCGARTILRQFRQAVRKLAEEGDLLDYAVAYDAERDIVVFRRLEGSLVERIAPAGGPDGIELPDSVADEARRRHGSGLDLAAARAGLAPLAGAQGRPPDQPGGAVPVVPRDVGRSRKRPGRLPAGQNRLDAGNGDRMVGIARRRRAKRVARPARRARRAERRRGLVPPGGGDRPGGVRSPLAPSALPGGRDGIAAAAARPRGSRGRSRAGGDRALLAGVDPGAAVSARSPARLGDAPRAGAGQAAPGSRAAERAPAGRRRESPSIAARLPRSRTRFRCRISERTAMEAAGTASAATRGGMAAAKAKGKLRGTAEGVLANARYRGTDLAKVFSMSRPTVYRTPSRRKSPWSVILHSAGATPSWRSG